MDTLSLAIGIAALVIGAGLSLYTYAKLGWRLPQSLDEVRALGPLALIGGLLLLVGTIVLVNVMRDSILENQGEKIDDVYRTEKDKYVERVDALDGAITDAQWDKAEAEAKATAAAEAATGHADTAGEHKAAADAHGDAAAAALARAEALRKQREDE